LTRKEGIFILDGKRVFTTDDWLFTADNGGGEKMNVLWIVNTNTFLLILLIIMVSYLTTQVNGLIRWLKRE
jgi:hypothetical protein